MEVMQLIILLILVIPSVTCDNRLGWTAKRLDHVFFYSGKQLPISLHQMDCEGRGMTMVYIRDEGENWFIRSHAGRKFNLRIGAEWSQTRNRFQWKNGMELTYTNWDPSYLDTSRHLNQSCTDVTGCCQVVMTLNGFWEIADCSKNFLHYTVCMKRIAASLITTFMSTEKATSDRSQNISESRSENDSKMNEFHTCDHSSMSWIDVLNLILNMIAIRILYLLVKMSIGKKEKKTLPIGWSPPSYEGNDNDSGFNVSFTRV